MATMDDASLVDGKYGIGDLVDLNQLNDIFEKFTEATGFTIGFLDHPEMNVLVATGWRDICTKFHRGCPASAEICTKSNAHLLEQLTEPNQLVIEACEHGLVDCATPIIINGKHIASLATGQLLLAEPDVDRFRRQAKQYGYDEQEYLNALDDISVVSEEQLRSITDFLGSLAVVITEQGYAGLKHKEEAAQLAEEVAGRKRTEAKLRSSERKYRMLHESIRDAFVSVAIDGRLLEFNKAYQTMVGYTEEELYTKTYEDLTPEKWHDFEMRIVKEQVLPRGYSDVYEKEYRRKDGTVFPVELRTILMQDDAGEPVAMWALIRDITERKQAEEQRIRMETQMLQVQKLESLGVLAGGIAHDFNNLLMGVLGNIDLAITDISPVSPARDNLLAAMKAGRSAADLCSEMLAYVGKGRFVVQRIDLHDLVTEMANIIDTSISKNAVLRYDFAENVPAIEADAAQLRQVIMNLIINASESSGDRECVISISTGAEECNQRDLAGSHAGDELQDGLYVWLEVSDTGKGMNDATMGRMFDPFFTTKFTGRGLGMSAILGIVRSHKGAIKVASKPDKGTTVRIYFPAASGPAAPRNESVDSAGWQGSGTVLLVDDEEDVRFVGESMLERIGFNVLVAVDGVDAVDMFRKAQEEGNEITCVILDLTMPRMNGEEAFRQIRHLCKDVPVLISSGYSKEEVSPKFTEQAIVGFIQKPYGRRALAKKLQTLLG